MQKHYYFVTNIFFMKLLVFYISDFLKPGTSVMDQHRFDAEPDPDPNYHFDADPDPDQGPDLDRHQNDADSHADPTPSIAHVGK
jgi:hypothetical protein